MMDIVLYAAVVVSLFYTSASLGGCSICSLQSAWQIRKPFRMVHPSLLAW
jgi:hypothetical protein